MSKNKKILYVGTFEEQIRVARIITGMSSKIANRETISDTIRVDFDEAELLSEIVVSCEHFK